MADDDMSVDFETSSDVDKVIVLSAPLIASNTMLENDKATVLKIWREMGCTDEALKTEIVYPILRESDDVRRWRGMWML